MGEGQLSTSKEILGWTIDSIKFRIFLPKLKFIAWSKEIDNIISSTAIKAKDLECLIGKLNHAAYILPFSRYFLTRLRYRQKQAEKFFTSTLSNSEKEDIILWKHLLHRSSSIGTRIDHITFSIPLSFAISDACPYGMGGFTSEGIAWRWQLPTELLGKLSINLLEFIAAIVTIYMSLKILKINESEKGIKLLSFTDSSSALGWLHHSTFNPVENPLHDKSARFLAHMMIDNNSSLYSQHIKGSQNQIADSLSRDFHWDNITLITHLRSVYDSQMPNHFQIYQLPEEIICWIKSLAHKLTVTTVLQEAHEKSSLDTLIVGKNFCQNVQSKIHSSLTTPQWKEVKSSVLSRTQSDIMNLAKLLNLPYEGRQSMPPSQMWQRPLKNNF